MSQSWKSLQPMLRKVSKAQQKKGSQFMHALNGTFLLFSGVTFVPAIWYRCVCIAWLGVGVWFWNSWHCNGMKYFFLFCDTKRILRSYARRASEQEIFASPHPWNLTLLFSNQTSETLKRHFKVWQCVCHREKRGNVWSRQGSKRKPCSEHQNTKLLSTQFNSSESVPLTSCSLRFFHKRLESVTCGLFDGALR